MEKHLKPTHISSKLILPPLLNRPNESPEDFAKGYLDSNIKQLSEEYGEGLLKERQEVISEFHPKLRSMHLAEVDHLLPFMKND